MHFSKNAIQSVHWYFSLSCSFNNLAVYCLVCATLLKWKVRIFTWTILFLCYGFKIWVLSIDSLFHISLVSYTPSTHICSFLRKPILLYSRLCLTFWITIYCYQHGQHFLRKPSLLYSRLCLTCGSLPLTAFSMEKVINLSHNVRRLEICQLHFSPVWYLMVSHLNCNVMKAVFSSGI